MLLKEVTPLYCDIHTKHKKHCVGKIKFLNVEAAGKYSNNGIF
jgi:hypothetical protein